MLEIDRLLQPGGYWVFSKPPVNWKSTYNISNQGTIDKQDNQVAMDDMSKRLRWTKVSEEGTISVWRKPSCNLHCDQEANAKLAGLPPLCTGEDPDSAWQVYYCPLVTLHLRSIEMKHVQILSTTAQPDPFFFFAFMLSL
jgi:hypothetical protein